MSKILIIEDELSIAELERDYLELNDFEVEIETNGLKGLEKALDEEYSLILLDLMLPEVDGFEICRQIREKKDIPIIMVTAKKNDIDKIRGLGLGVDDYVTKPFSPSELVARVKAHISRYERLVGSTALKNDVIEIRGLKIDKTEECMLITRRRYLRIRSSIYCASLPATQTRYFPRMSCSARYGIWTA